MRVTVDMVLANHLKDTATKRFYYDRAFLSVLPSTSGFKVTWSGGGTPKVKVSKKTSTYTLLQIDLAQRLYSGKSATYRLVFDLVDRVGRPSATSGSAARWCPSRSGPLPPIRRSGSTVRVVFPAGFKVEVEVGGHPGPDHRQ